ncbi:MAG: signal recognition particle receptor subunit alpha, partial [Rikenellaceae bacterium]
MGFFDLFKKKKNNESTESTTQATPQTQTEELEQGLSKTKRGLFEKLARVVAGRSTVDADLLDDLEELLITSDVGVETTSRS